VMANYWLHNGFLQVEGEKMAKSLGNFVTIRELLTDWKGLPWPGDAIRLALLMTHYPQPLDWTVDRLATAAAGMHRFHAVGVVGLKLDHDADVLAIPEIASAQPSEALLSCLMDDLNTPAAIAHLFSLAREADRKVGVSSEPAVQLLRDCLFLGMDPFRFAREQRARFLKHRRAGHQEIWDLVEARSAARKAKNFKEADAIRNKLDGMGIELEDRKDGTTIWKVKP
jgi:cysteinyl-tRNA synthetase